MRSLAKKLLALEAAAMPAPVAHGALSVKVSEKLRISLTRFAGADGFSALLGRAIALSRADAPSVQGLKVSADGSVVGLERVGDDAGVEIIAQLLGLLVTFIGEALTMRLVREAWPDAPAPF